MRPLVEDFRRWRDAVEPTLLPSEPLSRLQVLAKDYGK
jgi:hypothetical protein